MDMRAALYIRVSHDEQVKDGFSLEAQKESLIKYANENNYKIVDIYADEGISARKTYKNRKELIRLLEDVKENKIDVILFIKLDRWFRNVAEYHKIQDILEKHSVGWIATLENYDTTTANGRLYVNIRLAVAQDEADRTSERINFVFDKKVQDGEIISGSLPFGYNKKNKSLVVDPDNAEIVKYIFNTFYKIRSKRKTMLLAAEHFQRRITYHLVSKILKSEIYIGRYRGNLNFCESIIDEQIFYEVQELLNGIYLRYPKKTSEYLYIFSGLLVCPCCGNRLSSRSFKNRLGTIRRFHLCGKHVVEKKCSFRKVVNENKLEEYLLTNLRDELEKYKLQYTLSQNNKKTKKNISAEKNKIKTKMERLKDLYINELIDIDIYKKEYQNFQDELKQIEDNALSEKESKKIENIENFLNYNFEELYLKLDNSNKRSLWFSVIDKIVPDETVSNKYTIFFK